LFFLRKYKNQTTLPVNWSLVMKTKIKLGGAIKSRNVPSLTLSRHEVLSTLDRQVQRSGNYSG
jgi:hypothetical protein